MVWDISHDDLTPRSMLVGHSESVVGLDQVALGLTDIHIISVARNGSVFTILPPSISYVVAKAIFKNIFFQRGV